MEPEGTASDEPPEGPVARALILRLDAELTPATASRAWPS